MAKMGWVVAAVLLAVAVGEYFLLDTALKGALRQQAAGYEQKIAELQKKLAEVEADAASRVQKAQDEAAATQTVLQTELDYARLPQLPVKTVLRRSESGGSQVLYLENETGEKFRFSIRLKRPATGAEKKVEFELAPRSFKDVAALEDWLIDRGDQLEFSKDGYQTRRLEVP